MQKENTPTMHDLNYAAGSARKTPRPWWAACIFLGVAFLILWFSEEAATVVPGSKAVYEQWLWTRIYLFLAGLSLGAGIGSVVSGWIRKSS